MRFAHAAQGIENAVRCLRPCTQVENISIMDREGVISWRGRKPGIPKHTYYPLEYQALLDHQQYSLLLADGSFFQFYYDFGGNGVLVKARLAFYPAPFSTRDSMQEIADAAESALDREEQELFDHLYNWSEYMAKGGSAPSNNSHVRFDFDATTTSHCPSHIQFGGIHEMRVPANFVPQPLAFIQLCEPCILDGRVLVVDADFEDRHALELERPGQLMVLTAGR